MTLAGAPDWQSQIAATSTLLAKASRNSNAVFVLDITAGLLPQHMGIIVSIVYKAGNAAPSVDWQVQDTTLGIALLLDSAQSSTYPTMQVLPFPGQYVIQNPGDSIGVQFSPNGAGAFVGDVYVYGVTVPPITIPQPITPEHGVLLSSGIINMPAASNGNILSQSQPGFVNRVKHLCANHVAAAAAVSRVSWSDQFSAVPHLETLDLAVANFVWNNIVDFDNVVGINYNNGSSQAHRCMVSYYAVPQ